MAGHAALMELGPKLDWTRDHRCYERFLDWKREVELLFNSALTKASNAEKSSYVQLWMGKDSYPIVRKWTAENKLDFTRRVAADGEPISSGFLPETYFELLEAEFKPKANRIISIIHLWTQVKQGNIELNEWITRIINLVEECGYTDKNRIIRDALIVGTNSDRAKEKIVRKGSDATLEEVLEILQTEYSTNLMVQQYNSETKNVHYLKYDSRKGKAKAKGKNPVPTLLPRILANRILILLTRNASDVEGNGSKDTKKTAKLSKRNAIHVVQLVTLTKSARRKILALRSNTF